MKTTPENLPDAIKKLKALLVEERRLSAEKDLAIQDLKNKNHYLLEQFRLAQHKQFGTSSEGYSGQGDLFNEVEQILDEDDSSENAITCYTRKQPKRQPLPKDLPRQVIVHDIDDVDKVCGDCGEALHCMGEKTSEQLEFIPAQVKVIEHVRPQYSCRACEKNETEVSIKIAPVPAAPIPKSIATSSLLSQIITSKYQYSLPLYRQEAMFKQHGIALNRKTMSEWMMKCAELFKPIIEQWHQQLLQQPVIQADETTLNVLDKDKSKCYMWLYCTGTDSPSDKGLNNIVLYDYQASRSGVCAVDFLQGFQGYLQVDGYIGYEQTQAKLAGCWAHARRKFVEAQKAQPNNKTGKTNWALNHIQKLYRIESAIKEKTALEKQDTRQEKALPLLNDFKTWLDKSASQVPPKSTMGQAIAYCLNQWQKLIRYIDDGHLNIDNNRAERAIKPFVIGRKNWMFCNTQRGADASAILYSIIQTAKANGLMPFDYLMLLLNELPNKPECFELLMPWNVKLDS